ncbi:MAG: PH domain-containing protein [Phycisphaerales bacterium]|nr:PH domain-containing protein [Phycisphaerales bacterium]
MIYLKCDRCDKPLEVDDELAGKKVECPHCGDVNLVPEARTAAPVGVVSSPGKKPGRAEAAGYPPDHGPEVPVLKVRPAMLRARPATFLTLAAGVLAGITVIVLASGTGHLAKWMLWPGIAAALACSGVLAVWKVKTMGSALEISNKRSIERRGIFAKATSEVLHDAIRNIQIDQTFWNRVWRVGTIAISSSGTEGVEIQVADVPNPHRIREIIDLYRPL